MAHKIGRGRFDKGLQDAGAYTTPHSGVMYIGRPSRWGNPFPVKVKTVKGIREAVEAFEGWFFQPAQETLRADFVKAARKAWHPRTGLALHCWCQAGSDCHGDVLVEYLVRLAEHKANPQPGICTDCGQNLGCEEHHPDCPRA